MLIFNSVNYKLYRVRINDPAIWTLQPTLSAYRLVANDITITVSSAPETQQRSSELCYASAYTLPLQVVPPKCLAISTMAEHGTSPLKTAMEPPAATQLLQSALPMMLSSPYITWMPFSEICRLLSDSTRSNGLRKPWQFNQQVYLRHNTRDFQGCLESVHE